MLLVSLATLVSGTGNAGHLALVILTIGLGRFDGPPDGRNLTCVGMVS